MQQFLVPQFIDVENKILGPITVRQFVIMIVTIGLVFLYYKSLDFSAFLFFTIITLTLGASFAFLKVNGTLFHFFLLNVLQTTLRPALRVWDKKFSQELSKDNKEDAVEAGVVPLKVVKDRNKTTTNSRLTELSLVVNTGGYYKGEEIH